MASIIRQANGRRIIQFTDTQGKRRSLRLGKTNQRTAEALKFRIESLLFAALSGHTPDDETARWLAHLDSVMKRKLTAAGLIASRETMQLKAFLDAYVKSRCDTKPATHIVYSHTRRNLIEFFGPHKNIRNISSGDADEWRLYLIKQDLAENTIRRRCGIAKQFMNAACRKGLLDKNPFTDLKAAIQANPARMHFITQQVAQQVLDACPDAQWRLLFALSRYGGLRCPSEHLSLKWSDIHWDRNRITVPSPKTEHHLGGESRLIPLFPELLPYLQTVYDQAPPGTEYVITRYRSRSCNLRTQLHKIIRRAGLQAWPKLFQNLRSSRETELAETYPLHVVCAWLGNSQPVAAKHYLQVTDQHFALAAGMDQHDSPHSALQKALQQAAVLPGTALHQKTDRIYNSIENKDLRNHATTCHSTKMASMGDTGLEPVTSCV